MLGGGLKTLVMCLKILFSSLKVCSKKFYRYFTSEGVVCFVFKSKRALGSY